MRPVAGTPRPRRIPSALSAANRLWLLRAGDLVREHRACATGLVGEVDFVAGEAVSLTRIAGEGLRVELRDGGAVHGRRVVLGLGSLPSRLARHLEGAPGYIHDLPREEGAILRAFGRTGLADRTVAKNVVVVGANAAAMEAIYTLRH